MLALLTIFSSSTNRFNGLLSRIESPSFIELSEEDEEDYELNKRYNIGKTITGDVSEKVVRTNEYFFSSIVVEGAKFSNNFAFGAAASAPGYGGAIFVSHSTLFLEKDYTFLGNKANVGGCICSIMSNAYIVLQGTGQFTSNIAYKYGGAIYFQGQFEEIGGKLVYSDQSVLEITNSEEGCADSFSKNEATQLGGAICLSMVRAVIMSGVTFCSNKAGISGGAIASFNTALRCTKCIFSTNRAGQLERRISDTENFQDSTPIFSGKGGGAVLFSADKYSEDTENENYIRVFVSESCCFISNSADKATDFNSRPGHEVMLDGFVHWSSYLDVAKFNEKSVGYSDKNGFKPIANFIGISSEATELCKDLRAVDISASDPSFITKDQFKRNGDGKTSYIPSPSIYTYVATPVPETPYATTSSWSVYNKRTNKKEKPTVPTAYASAYRTPDVSPFSSPYRTPDISPFSSPFSSPYRSPLNSPFSSPFSSPFTTPYITPSMTVGNIYVPPIIPPGKTAATTEMTTWFMTETSTNIENEPTKTNIPTYDVTTVIYPTDIGSELNDGSASMDKTIMVVIIASAVGGIILLLLISLLVWFFVAKKSSTQSSESIIEMEEETVIKATDQDQLEFTNENPLWTTSVMGDTDDPFRNDFEEEYLTGLFRNH